MSNGPLNPHAEPGRQPERDTPAMRLIAGAYGGDQAEMEQALRQGARVDDVHLETGLSALHIAVGLNDISTCRFLIEKCGASFFPDRFGRWPTLVAAECGVDDDLSDYIVEREAAYLAAHPQQAS